MSAQTETALVTAFVLLTVLVWFDLRCLADLARTADRELRYFSRNVWALIIILFFPIGPVLYLMYAKGSRVR